MEWIHALAWIAFAINIAATIGSIHYFRKMKKIFAEEKALLDELLALRSHGEDIIARMCEQNDIEVPSQKLH